MILVISVRKIFVNGQFEFNLSSKTWSHFANTFANTQTHAKNTKIGPKTQGV